MDITRFSPRMRMGDTSITKIGYEILYKAFFE